MQPPVSVERIERKIYFIRDQKVMLDSDLAQLYQVQTKNLNKAVKRNLDRFPEDFMFRITPEEIESLRFQIGTSNTSQGGRRYLPYVFSEHGVAMLSSVLNSKRAVQVNIVIVRTFIKLREVLSTHKDLARRIDDLDLKYQEHDQELKVVFDAIRKLISTPEPSKRKIGFAGGNS
jgi:phage regulator Rha-like protein